MRSSGVFKGMLESVAISILGRDQHAYVKWFNFEKTIEPGLNLVRIVLLPFRGIMWKRIFKHTLNNILFKSKIPNSHKPL